MPACHSVQRMVARIDIERKACRFIGNVYFCLIFKALCGQVA